MSPTVSSSNQLMKFLSSISEISWTILANHFLISTYLLNAVLHPLQGSVVLEMAHKIDPSSPQDAIPSRDMLINSLVFNLGDVVQITAAAVDLDYANKGW